MTSLLLLPAMTGATQENEMPPGYDHEAAIAEREAELRAYWDAPSSLDAAAAAQVMGNLQSGEAIDGQARLELLRFLRDQQAAGAPGAGEAGRLFLVDLLNEAISVDAPEVPTDVPLGWGDAYWDTYGLGLTLAYVGLYEATGDSRWIVPHDVQVPVLHLGYDFAAGTVGSITRGYVYLTLMFDVMMALTWDLHQTTDSFLLEMPLGLELQLHWSCSWTGCSTWVETVDPHCEGACTVAGRSVDWGMASGATAGHVATRATDHDVYQMVYDELGFLNNQRGRHWTSAPQWSGTPGMGDLHAAAPTMNYYGVQKAVGNIPYDVPQQNQNPYGTVPLVDSTGNLAGYEMSHLDWWDLNLAVVRWKNVGTGSGDLAESPMKLTYGVSNYLGGGAAALQFEYGIADSIL